MKDDNEYFYINFDIKNYNKKGKRKENRENYINNYSIKMVT
jgi:hypothetical protein